MCQMQQYVERLAQFGLVHSHYKFWCNKSLILILSSFDLVTVQNHLPDFVQLYVCERGTLNQNTKPNWTDMIHLHSYFCVYSEQKEKRVEELKVAL